MNRMRENSHRISDTCSPYFHVDTKTQSDPNWTIVPRQPRQMREAQ
jgi:hypothetical protein